LSLFNELKRRNVFRVAAAYVVTAWLIIQVVETIFPAFGIGDAAIRLVVIVFAIGFVPVVVLAWAFELTPEGLKKDSDVDRTQSVAPQSGRKLDRAIMVVLALALGYFAVDKFVLDPARDLAELESATQRGRSEALLESYGDKSIAVLPFVNMSSDPEQEYFSDGLSEELLNLLAGVKDLKVAARTSSFYYKGKLDEITFAEIAQQLGVAHVLEGSVRKSGDRLRITAQLIRTDSGFHIWSETFDRTLDDIFVIQDEIAALVVDSLKITLLGEAPHSRVTSTEAYELTLQGRYFYNRRATGDEERALDHFERAVELEPGIAEAWIGLVPLYLRIKDPPQIERAREAIEKALAIDPDNPEAHVRLGLVLAYEGEVGLGWLEAERALELGPDNPLALSVIAGKAHAAGDLDRAIELQSRAVAIDPLHIVNRGNLTVFLEHAGRLDEAMVQARKADELSPGDQSNLKALARIRLMQGYPEEAYGIIQQLPEDFEQQYYLANVLFSLGDIEAADAAMREYQELYAADWPLMMAGMHAWRGEADQAFEWMDRSLQENPDMERQWTYDRFLSGLHDDPRWEAFMANWDTPSE
jgi:TolB-like protein/Flp pilus assembly protein TadD